MGKSDCFRNFKINFHIWPLLFLINVQYVHSLNITKCCKSNEIIHISKSDSDSQPSCKAVTERSPKWKPFLYKNPHEKADSDKDSWNDIEINYVTIENVTLSKIVFQRGYEKELPGQNPLWRHKYWRLLTNGSSFTVLVNRQWFQDPLENHSYCVDGLHFGHGELQNGKVDYVEDENNQILLIWETNPVNTSTYNIHTEIDDNEKPKALLYSILAFTSAFFDSITFITYSILFSKSNSSGWTILGLVGTSLIKEVLLGVCHLMRSLDESELYLNTWTSQGLAVSLHFFALSSFVWIALMSFDLMKTIRSRILVRKKETQCFKFASYCLIGWVLPLVMVSSFVTLDFIYVDPITEVIVPEYGVYNLFIVPEAQGIYLYYIILAILLINLTFTGIAACCLWDLKQNQKILNQEGFSSSVSSGFISLKLCLKLFILTGSVWVWEFISWAHAGTSNPWYYVMIDVLIHLQSLWMFLIFVCNASTIKELMGKYKKTKESIGNMNFNIVNFNRSDSQETQISDLSN